MARIWTEEELETLKEIYPTSSKRECAEALNRPVRSVVAKARGLGLEHDARTDLISFEEMEIRIRILMEQLDTQGHLPRCADLRDVGITAYQLSQYGGLSGISKRLGIPQAPFKWRWVNLDRKNDIRTMEQVKPSKAFEIQTETGKRWADIQREETLEAFGRVDVSQFEGLKPYGERMAAHG